MRSQRAGGLRRGLIKSRVFATLVAIAAALVGAAPAYASGPSAASAKDAQENIARAIEEQRLTDASLLLDHALINSPTKAPPPPGDAAVSLSSPRRPGPWRSPA